MTLPPRLLSGTAVSTLGRVVGTALSVVTVGVVTRGLSAEAGVAGYGAYAAVFAFLGVVAVLADGGFYLLFTKAAAVRETPEELSLLRRLLGIRLATFVLGAAIIAVAVSLLQYPAVVRAGMLLGAAGIFSQLVTQLLLGSFQKRLRMAIPAVADVVGRASTLLLAALVARAGGSLLQYVGAFVVGAAVTLVVQVGGLIHLLRAPAVPKTGPPVPLPTTRELLFDAWPLAALLVCWMVVFRADSLLLSYLRPPADLGWYALPYKVLESLLFFPAMIGGLLLPSFSRAAARAELPHMLRAASDLFLLLALPAVAVLFFLAPVVIALLGGPLFAASVPVLRILALALGALFFGNLYGNGAIALGAQRPLLGLAFVLAVGNVTLNLFVIPRYSFMGAAWTTLATELLSAFGAAGLVWRILRTPLFSQTSWRIVWSGGILLVVLLLPLPLVSRLAAGLAAYLGALWAFRVVTAHSLRELLSAQRVRAAPHER